MKTNYLAVVVAATLSVAAIGCSSSSSCADGGTCPDAGGTGGVAGTGGAGGNAGPTLYPLTPGTFCFDVVSIAPGFNDGCMIGVDALVGTAALPVTYDMTGMTVEVGTMGSLGIGTVAANKATLLRDNSPSDPTVTTCTWHQTDSSQFELTAENTFTLAVTEQQAQFSASCGPAGLAPTGGACTSTWTWTMKIDGSLTPPTCK